MCVGALSSLSTMSMKNLRMSWKYICTSLLSQRRLPLGVSRYILAGSSESLHVQRGRLNLSVRRHAFILPPIKEILALMADEGPFSKRTSGIGTRRHSSASGRCAKDRFEVDALLRQEALCWKWESWRLEAHRLVCAKALVNPFQREAEMI